MPRKTKKDIEVEIDWQVYFDDSIKKPLGQGFSVIVAAPDEQLPEVKVLDNSKVSVRRAKLTIYKKEV